MKLELNNFTKRIVDEKLGKSVKLMRLEEVTNNISDTRKISSINIAFIYGTITHYCTTNRNEIEQNGYEKIIKIIKEEIEDFYDLCNKKIIDLLHYNDVVHALIIKDTPIMYEKIDKLGWGDFNKRLREEFFKICDSEYKYEVYPDIYRNFVENDRLKEYIENM